MITGETRAYGVIGDPVRHSLSPLIHNKFAELTGEDLIYCAFPVAQNSLKAAIDGAYALDIRGLNVTMPHKTAVMPLCVSTDETAQAAGAANTLKLAEGGYIGYNTDVAGVSRSLAAIGAAVKGGRVIILGAGGAAKAAAVAAAKDGASQIIIANRTVESAKELANAIIKGYNINAMAAELDVTRDFDGCDVLINATSIGFGGQAGLSPVQDAEWFNNVGAFLETIYNPWETKALADARARGVNCANGFEMLFRQAAKAFEIWTGKELSEETLAQAQKVLTFNS